QLQPPINQGSTVVLNIGNLALNQNQTTILFNGYVGTFPEGPSPAPTTGTAFNVNTLGQTNLNNSSQIFISTINGQPIDVVYGLLGGWASGNGGSFATYDSVAGYEAFASGLTNSAGTPVATYAASSIIGATATQNITDG